MGFCSGGGYVRIHFSRGFMSRFFYITLTFSCHFNISSTFSK